MTVHLGAEIAALVDDQLPADRRDAALAHLEHCEMCLAQVRAQQLAKSQMGTLRPINPPETLMASLCAIGTRPHHRPGREHHRTRERAALLLMAGGLSFAVVSGASMAVSPDGDENSPGPVTRQSPSPAPAAALTPAVYARRAGPAAFPAVFEQSSVR